jgi:hypothetical protein
LRADHAWSYRFAEDKIGELFLRERRIKMGKPPDYNLSILNVETQQRNHSCGAAWNNDDGSIQITLNYGIVLRSDEAIRIRLFPNDRKHPAKSKSKPEYKDEYAYGNDKICIRSRDDDIPF